MTLFKHDTQWMVRVQAIWYPVNPHPHPSPGDALDNFTQCMVVRFPKVQLYVHVVLKNFQPSWSWSYGSRVNDYLCNQCLSPLMMWVRISISARCMTFCDKVCQSLATGRWFSPGPPVSSPNKTDCHDISEILLKVTLNTIKQNKTNNKHGKTYIFHLHNMLYITLGIFVLQ